MKRIITNAIRRLIPRKVKKYIYMTGVVVIVAGIGKDIIDISQEAKKPTPEVNVTESLIETVKAIQNFKREILTTCETYVATDVNEADHVFTILNNNIPQFTEEEKKNTKSFEIYSELDKLGRCGMAYANICKDIMPTEERGEIGHIKPTGWHTVKYPGIVDGNYLYNRCHLIAFCLAGENDNEKNLITGTRYFNVNGMLPFETQVAEYIDKNPENHVLYKVTPVFKDDELVARNVIIEAWSVEDNGAGICFHVEIPNIQPGIAINYATGESRESEEK